eukprot:TRINITY_DN3690_c0_g2_i1.p1 TRINITY_DN3690_c0_g2~~TRINITY_DN3690_c0_g2_i1.p1  ORF type:complete len:1019 (+),score=245.76 TRINITY_DN3690_c0_g2_i1:69-3059(+)
MKSVLWLLFLVFFVFVANATETVYEVQEQFSNWIQNGDNDSLESEGLKLASMRLKALKSDLGSNGNSDDFLKLFQHDLDISSAILESLPADVKALLATNFSGSGDFTTICSSSILESTPEQCLNGLKSKGKRYHVYLPKELQGYLGGSVKNLPVHGIRIGNIILMEATSLRRLNDVSLHLGTHIERFESSKATNQRFNDCHHRNESHEVFGHCATSKGVSLRRNLLTKIGDVSTINNNGARKILALRMEFPDGTDKHLQVQSAIWSEASDFYARSSDNLSWFDSEIDWVPGIGYFKTNHADVTTEEWLDLFADAEEFIDLNGYDRTKYDHYVVLFPNVATLSFGGLGYVGKSGTLINTNEDPDNMFRLITHEIGHNCGLLHSQFIQKCPFVSDTCENIIEYGDPFDVMGAGTYYYDLFHAYQKYILGWLPDSDIRFLHEEEGSLKQNSEDVFLYAFDSRFTDGELQVLVGKQDGKFVWMEYRYLRPGQNDKLIVHFSEDNVNKKSQLFDHTSHTVSASDAGVNSGSSIELDGLVVTPMGRVECPNKGSMKCLKVNISKEFVSNNSPPIAHLSISDNYVSTYEELTITLDIVDLDGDAPIFIEYDFDDGTTEAFYDLASAKSVTHRWTTFGYKFISVFVFDGKSVANKAGNSIATKASAWVYVGNSVIYKQLAPERITIDKADSVVKVEPTDFDFSNVKDEFSITARVRLDTNAPEGYHMIFAMSNPTIYVSLYNNAYGVQVFALVGDGENSVSKWVFVGTTIDRDYHIGFSWIKNHFVLYCDGLPVTTSYTYNGPELNLSSQQTAQFGAWDYTNLLTGDLWDAMITNFAMGSNTMIDMYELTNPCDISPCQNDGGCTPSTRLGSTFTCDCSNGGEGPLCVGPSNGGGSSPVFIIISGLLLVTIIIGVVLFIKTKKNKTKSDSNVENGSNSNNANGEETSNGASENNATKDSNNDSNNNGNTSTGNSDQRPPILATPNPASNNVVSNDISKTFTAIV